MSRHINQLLLLKKETATKTTHPETNTLVSVEPDMEAT